MTATTVRVPVFRCHSESVNIETEKNISANEVRAILSGAPGVIVYDDPKKNLYPLAIDVAGKDEVYVGRIREDESDPERHQYVDRIRQSAQGRGVERSADSRASNTVVRSRKPRARRIT